MIPVRTFRYREDGAVVTITLDRPNRLNALTFEVYAELRDTFAALQAHDHVRASLAPTGGEVVRDLSTCGSRTKDSQMR